MNRRLEHREHAAGSRGGVSLVEMLVVIAIILTLATVAWVALGQTGNSARIASTRTTLTKLDSILKSRIEDLRSNFTEQERKNTLNTADWMNLQAAANAHLDPDLPLASKLAIVKPSRYRGALPQREADMYGLDNAVAAVDNSPLLAIWNGSTPVWNNKLPQKSGNHLPETESSELLWLALTLGVRSGSNADVLGDINPRHIQDTDNDGFPEFVDDWGKPLRFYNAPTRLIRPGGAGAAVTTAQRALAASLISAVPALPIGAATDPGYYGQSFNVDPFDPRRALGNAAVSGIRDTFENFYHTLDTWYQPLIVSCGPDEALGMGEPAESGALRLGLPVVDAEGNTEASDNVTSGQSVGGN